MLIEKIVSEFHHREIPKEEFQRFLEENWEEFERQLAAQTTNQFLDLNRASHLINISTNHFFQRFQELHGDELTEEEAIEVLNMILLKKTKCESVRDRQLSMDDLRFMMEEISFQENRVRDTTCRISNPPTISSIKYFYDHWFSIFIDRYKHYILPDSLWTKKIPGDENEYLIRGFLTREQVGTYLRESGMFLVRLSSSIPGQLVVSCNEEGRVSHYLLETEGCGPGECRVAEETGIRVRYSSWIAFIESRESLEYYYPNGVQKIPIETQAPDFVLISDDGETKDDEKEEE